MILNNINILDCTLRDGGYYNNWNFSPKLIASYIKLMHKLEINYIEIGFISFEQKKSNPGSVDKFFLSSYDFPSNLKIGLMINAKELFNLNRIDKKKIDILFKEKLTNKVNFLRFACNYSELDQIIILTKDVRFKNYKIFINLYYLTYYIYNHL